MSIFQDHAFTISVILILFVIGWILHSLEGKRIAVELQYGFDGAKFRLHLLALLRVALIGDSRIQEIAPLLQVLDVISNPSVHGRRPRLIC